MPRPRNGRTDEIKLLETKRTSWKDGREHYCGGWKANYRADILKIELMKTRFIPPSPNPYFYIPVDAIKSYNLKLPENVTLIDPKGRPNARCGRTRGCSTSEAGKAFVK
ncbi:hypothetical protein SASPL_114122 [Salvia splendens]|uniref:Uncharacterized protein n=1 Tax=Salvia splendens TaxID=180675 RepID=A0A8X9A1Q6_SALSN|nr:hypothetical protein SASPL_114122 [Salvia splendens]